MSGVSGLSIIIGLLGAYLLLLGQWDKATAYAVTTIMIIKLQEKR